MLLFLKLLLIATKHANLVPTYKTLEYTNYLSYYLQSLENGKPGNHMYIHKYRTYINSLNYVRKFLKGY